MTAAHSRSLCAPGQRVLLALIAAVYAAGPAHSAPVRPPAVFAPVVETVQRGDCPAVLADLRHLSQRPAVEGARAGYLLAHCLTRDGQFDDAARIFDSVAAALPPLAPHARFYAAVAAFRAGRPEDAASRLGALLNDGAPADLELRGRLLHAEVMLEMRRAAAARDLLQDLLPRLTGDEAVARAWWLLGRAAEGVRDRPLAAQAYGMAWWAVPDNPFATEAERRLTRLQPRSVPPAVARADRGQRLIALGRFDEAENELSAAVRGRLPAGAAAEAWYRLGLLRRGTRRAVTAFRQAARYPQQRARALYWLGRAYLSVADRDRAVATWQRVTDDFATSSWAPRALLSLAGVAEAGDRSEAVRLLTVLTDRYAASPSADEARWRLGWFAYRDDRFADAERIFLAAVARYPHTPRAAAHLYWAAKARARRGGSKDDLLFLLITRYPHTFYGQRARLLQADPPPIHLPGPPPVALRGDRAHEAFEELAALGFAQDAVAIARPGAQADHQADLARIIAWLHAELGAHHASIAATEPAIADALYRRRSVDDDLWMLSYPRAYWDVVQDAARRAGTDPLLVLAVIREESRFNRRAVSAARAIGLMQLLPPTASGIAGRPLTPADLMVAEQNVRYGTTYLAGMRRRFDGDVVLALAAYNAGPGAARRFAQLPRDDPDVFLESIPFAETRAYIQRVLQTYGIYRWLYR